jgi:hypothetical protein
MANYLFAYHGGKMAETPEGQQEQMALWGAWFGTLGEAIFDGGNPIAMARTINADGSVVDGGGSSPTTGYSIVSAASLDDAVALAKGCPILSNEGSVEVCETIAMEPDS